MACGNLVVHVLEAMASAVGDALKPASPRPVPRGRASRPAYHEPRTRGRTAPRPEVVYVNVSHSPSYYRVAVGLDPTRPLPAPRFSPGASAVHSMPVALPGSANDRARAVAMPASPDVGPALPWPPRDR